MFSLFLRPQGYLGLENKNGGLKDAARELGVNYSTIKQWIYHRNIKSVLTAGGHHRIPRAEIDRFSFYGEAGKGTKKKSSLKKNLPKGLEHFIIGRNQLVGRVTNVEIVGLVAKVALDIGNQTVTAIITSDGCRDLGLRSGQTAVALVSATDVMIIGRGP
jgi:molybdopterin-binding protein